MVPRSNGRDAQNRRDDDHPSWMTDDDDHMATSSSAPTERSKSTDDDDDYQGPPSTTPWSKPATIPASIPIPPWASWYLSKDTLVTSTVSSTIQHTSYEPTSASTPTAATAAVSDDQVVPTATMSPNYESEPIGDPSRKQHSNNGPVYAAAGVVPVLVIGIIGFVLFFCMRKRRKQRQVARAQAQVQEMKSQQPTVRAYMAPTVPVSRAPSYTAPMNVAAAPTSPPPVILGPISAGSDGNYMTGIDTSDLMSTRNDRTGLGDPFADGNSLHEEPPPPYKPRSLASRHGSLRIPRSSMSVSSQQSQRQRIQPFPNPFEDPQEDDAVSDLSGPTLNRNHDNMSAVSDLSYQQDPEIGRGTS